MVFAATLLYLMSIPVVCLYLYGILTTSGNERYKYSLAYAVTNTLLMTAIGAASQIGILIALVKYRLFVKSQVSPATPATVSACAYTITCLRCIFLPGDSKE